MTDTPTLGCDGAHYFAVTLSTFGRDAVPAVEGTLLVMKSSPECEIVTMVTDVTDIDVQMYRVADDEKTISWTGAFETDETTFPFCRLMYSTTFPSALIADMTESND